MKNKIVTPILAIVIAAVVLLGGKAALSGIAEENLSIARNKMMSALLPGSTSFVPEEFDAEQNSAIKSVYKAETGFIIESVAYGYNGDVTLMVGVSNEGVMVLHCLPAHREEEITAKVFEAHAKEIFEEAENRLHAQKAVLVKLLKD